MHIVEVEIDNFKSFAHKTAIPFQEGYTVVTGPNGSGKSNIIDAILFVLSLSSSRNLRAENMGDFINTNSGKNTAEVTLEFSDGTRIRRKIKQTASSTYSYYYLNDRTSSQAEILDFLAKNGIRPHGYNVVMQGDLNRIMSMGDTERRGIIDGIAGVAEFDAKKDQALGELEKVREQIEREELLLDECGKRLAELASAREDAVKWVKLNQDLDYYNAAKKSADIRKLELELSTVSSLHQDQEGLRKTHEESQKMLENERDARKEEVADLDRKIAEKQGPEYMKIIDGQSEQKVIIQSSETAIVQRQKDKEELLAAMNRIYTETQRYQQQFDESTGKVQTLKIDHANLSMELETQKKVLAKAEELIAKRNQESTGAKQELVELMDKVTKKKEECDALYVEREGITEKSRARQSELERYVRDAENLASERADLVKEQEELSTQLGSTQEGQKVLVKQIAEAERKMMKVKKDLDATRSEINRLKVRQAKLDGYERASGGSDRAIEAVSGFEGVRGTVARLGKVLKAEHTTALNIAAGGRLKNVIADSDRVAADCIQHLKEEGLGRLTFLPLNKLKEAQPLPPLAGNGIIDYAINLIDFPPEYRQAFNLVFGQTVIVSNLDAARRMMGRYRMVTLEGDLVEKAGSMTGGSVNKDIRGFGVSTGNESAEIAAKIAELMQTEEELEEADKREGAVVFGLREEKSEKDAAVTELNLRLANCAKELEKISRDEEEFENLKTATANDAKERSSEIAELEAHIDTLREDIGIYQKRIDELKAVLDEDEFRLLTDELQKARNAVHDAETRLSAKTQALNEAGLERSHAKRNLDEKILERTKTEERLASYDADIAGYRKAIEDAQEVIATFEEKLAAFTGEIAELTTERSRVQKEADDAQQRITAVIGEIEKCSIQLKALEERSESVSAEIAVLKNGIETEVECDLSLEEILDRIYSTERAIKRLGNVNQQAIEQYDKLEKETAEKRDRKDTLSREREAILAKIESFKQMKHDAFMNAYDAINTNFQQIYRQLNDGAGQLVLDDYEDPFNGGMNFEVSPKGKDVHRLNMMSGGEKALTTLSFIFAIQQHMPAPFYALDEVDSALDGVNVERLSQMVRRITDESQFVIVSHRKPMISGADRMMGVTIRQKDKSTLVTGIKESDKHA